MEKYKGSESLNQNSSLSLNNVAFSTKEQQVLAAFFSILFEIDQQNNVAKEYVDAKQAK
jgi:hypothetical protein